MTETKSKKVAPSVFRVLGTMFLVQGFYTAYLLTPWAEAYETDVSDILDSMTFLGLPMAVLCFSIPFAWNRTSKSRSLQYMQFAFCMILHIANFVLAIKFPWGQATRYGGGFAAILFAGMNFATAAVSKKSISDSEA